VEHVSSRFYFSAVFLFDERDISAGAHRSSGSLAERDVGGRLSAISAGLAKNEEGERRRKGDPGRDTRVGPGEGAQPQNGKDWRRREGGLTLLDLEKDQGAGALLFLPAAGFDPAPFSFFAGQSNVSLTMRAPLAIAAQWSSLRAQRCARSSIG
jgi:hypothetical protein